MGGYTKNVAILKGIGSGFSADGKGLYGVVKAERYGGVLKVECCPINLAPIVEGRVCLGISDGKHIHIFDGIEFEGESEVDTSSGFATLLCFVINGSIQPIAFAVCGDFSAEIKKIKTEIERGESVIKNTTSYEDEAISEVNYYEYDVPCKDGGAVRTDKKEEEKGRKACEDEKNLRPDPRQGEFYDKVEGEVERVLASYPKAKELCEMIQGSRWVKIECAEDKYYVFGVIYSKAQAKYICYGVPDKVGSAPPESMRHIAEYLPVKDSGYWIIYQDAKTGKTIEVE
jgi:hypothetical protein